MHVVYPRLSYQAWGPKKSKTGCPVCGGHSFIRLGSPKGFNLALHVLLVTRSYSHKSFQSEVCSRI